MFWEVGECDGIVAVEWVGGWFGFVKEDGRIKNPETRDQRPETRDQRPEIGDFHRKGAKVAKGRKGGDGRMSKVEGLNVEGR